MGYEAKLMKISQEIHARHRCGEHKVADYVQSDGTHITYTMSQISKWAELVVCINVLFRVLNNRENVGQQLQWCYY
jgi:hypothetical protein